MDWWTPTRRAVRWSPVVASMSLGMATLVVMRLLDDRLPEPAQVVMLAMIVIGGVSGLDDPARNFIHPMPVSALRRLSHRLVMLVPPVLIGVVVVRSTADVLFSVVAPAPGGAALAALGAVGVATSTLLTRRLGERANDVAVMALLAWVVGGIVLARHDAPVWLATPWWRYPVAVGSAGVLVALLSTTRGVEA